MKQISLKIKTQLQLAMKLTKEHWYVIADEITEKNLTICEFANKIAYPIFVDSTGVHPFGGICSADSSCEEMRCYVQSLEELITLYTYYQLKNTNQENVLETKENPKEKIENINQENASENLIEESTLSDIFKEKVEVSETSKKVENKNVYRVEYEKRPITPEPDTIYALRDSGIENHMKYLPRGDYVTLNSLTENMYDNHILRQPRNKLRFLCNPPYPVRRTKMWTWSISGCDEMWTMREVKNEDFEKTPYGTEYMRFTYSAANKSYLISECVQEKYGSLMRFVNEYYFCANKNVVLQIIIYALMLVRGEEETEIIVDNVELM
ncbi:MAG TPA: hypothetical protein VLE02_01580 [Nitrosarchaeum sp.]|nr:hypothetical protein [Nitrosarchaeum sp.]